MVSCHSCDNQLPEGMVDCPYCGAEIRTRDPWSSTIIGGVTAREPDDASELERLAGQFDRPASSSNAPPVAAAPSDTALGAHALDFDPAELISELGDSGPGSTFVRSQTTGDFLGAASAEFVEPPRDLELRFDDDPEPPPLQASPALTPPRKAPPVLATQVGVALSHPPVSGVRATAADQSSAASAPVHNPMGLASESQPGSTRSATASQPSSLRPAGSVSSKEASVQPDRQRLSLNAARRLADSASIPAAPAASASAQFAVLRRASPSGSRPAVGTPDTAGSGQLRGRTEVTHTPRANRDAISPSSTDRNIPAPDNAADSPAMGDAFGTTRRVPSGPAPVVPDEAATIPSVDLAEPRRGGTMMGRVFTSSQLEDMAAARAAAKLPETQVDAEPDAEGTMMGRASELDDLLDAPQIPSSALGGALSGSAAAEESAAEGTLMGRAADLDALLDAPQIPDSTLGVSLSRSPIPVAAVAPRPTHTMMGGPALTLGDIPAPTLDAPGRGQTMIGAAMSAPPPTGGLQTDAAKPVAPVSDEDPWSDFTEGPAPGVSSTTDASRVGFGLESDDETLEGDAVVVADGALFGGPIDDSQIPDSAPTEIDVASAIVFGAARAHDDLPAARVVAADAVGVEPFPSQLHEEGVLDDDAMRNILEATPTQVRGQNASASGAVTAAGESATRDDDFPKAVHAVPLPSAVIPPAAVSSAPVAVSAVANTQPAPVAHEEEGGGRVGTIIAVIILLAALAGLAVAFGGF